ncbi:type IV pilus modification PilV family protein [Salibacterium halotolerans]|uniref:Prepilin-type N-terminal cleavage/methylation domain-containing protein n=1 Tax=Salibacterium halotolerans TaxID=1884432 RepID=A0A1I5WRG5_9BACI|nr:type II secretion system protein [Salibacterium halotolerans]SFQ22290.1 prepilin-type N-terminal cleavage/methylation domain-containing protein [Salibacterium halotolerans]
MKKAPLLLRQQGFTLVELLASLTILSIVIISFLSFFSQYILFSVRAEDELTAVNAAEEVMYEVKNEQNQPGEIQLNNKTYYPDVHLCRSDMEELGRVHVEIFREQNPSSSAEPLSELYSYVDTDEYGSLEGAPSCQS